MEIKAVASQQVLFAVTSIALSLCCGSVAQAVSLTAKQNDTFEISHQKVAIIQPQPEELWIVTQGESPQEENVQALRQVTGARKVEQLDVIGGQGVRFVFSRPKSWQATQAENNNWVLKTGGPQEANQQSLLILRDRIIPEINFESVAEVRSRETGRRARVALSQKQGMFPYKYQTTQGVLWPSLAGLALSEGPDMYIEGRELAFVPNPTPLPTIPVQSNLVASAEESVTTLTQPQTQHVAYPHIPEELIHHPDQAVPFTLPRSYGRLQLNERQRKYAQAFGAVAEALQRVDEVAGPDAPTVTLVEETSPEKTESQEPVRRVAIPKDEVFMRRLSLKEEKNFRLLEAQKLEEVTQAKTGSQKNAAILDLARIYIVFQRYDQAEGALRSLPTKDNMPIDMMARTLLGATLVLQEKKEEALEILETVEGVEPHRQIWLGAAQVQNEQYDAAANNLKSKADDIAFYPEQVVQKLSLIEGKMLLETLQYSTLFEKMDALSTGPTGEMPPLAKYYLALAQLELGATDDGRRMLAEVAESGTDKIAMRAKVEFLLDMARSRDVLNPQLIMFLEDLRYLWRGDDVEATVLRELGNRYIEERSFRLGLDRFKSYAVAFPYAEDMDDVTELMRNAFVQIFDDGNRYLQDDLGLLGMYFDFRELTPADEKGDRLVEKVAGILSSLLLNDRAAGLFERQLEYRVEDPIQQAKLGIQLAGLYRKNDQPYDALAALEKWVNNQELPVSVKRDFAIEKARTLLDMGRYKEAQQAVSSWLDDASRDVQVDIAWQGNDYPTVARLLSQMFDTNEHGGFSEVQTRTDFVRLVYALAQLEEKDALTQLLTNYREDIKNHVDVADVVNVYAARAEIDKDLLVFTDGRPLQRIAKQILSLNAFEDSYEQLREVQTERRRLHEIYNQKQDYMKYLRENGLL